MRWKGGRENKYVLEQKEKSEMKEKEEEEYK